jgi:heat-inducible transcriptional repressor
MTASDPNETLDPRKGAILRAIVEQYVHTANPVGSQTIVATSELGVSAATVRNDMGVLEREGFITHPHTSAGRIPTDKGYRFFVDNYVGSSQLSGSQRRAVSDFFTSTTRVMDDLLHETSQLLARLTDHAAVVVGPQPDIATVRSVQLVSIQPRVVLALVVLSNGVVEKETLLLDSDASEDDVRRAGEQLQSAMGGRPFSEVHALAPDEAARPSRSDELAAAAADALRVHCESRSESVFVGGASRLAAEGASFTSPQNLTRLLELLEQQVVVVAVLRELLGPGLTVRIGSETERADLAECSLVLAPYLVEGQPVGTIGVLGPTRMDYRQAQAAVATISAQLSRSLPG